MAKRAGIGMARARRLRAASVMGATAGTLGGIACSGTMILAAAGVIGAAGASGATSMSMAGMGHDSTRGGGVVSRFLLDNGPTILVVSIVLVTLALALRGRAASVAATFVGAAMYWGMYVQADGTIMYVTIAVGLITWLGLILAASGFAMKPRG